MGKWVILIGDRNFDINAIKTMNFDGKTEVRDYKEKQFDVIFDKEYISFQFDFDGMIKHDYSPEELKNLPYNNPQCILVKYSSQKLLESIIGSKDFPKDLFIDCDGVNLLLEHSIDKTRLINNTDS